MKYGSVCSGIEAATMAWHPLGWRPAFFSEIDKFPSAVLAHRYPTVPNLGDMTRYEEWPDDAIDLLVGGTPCQSFSIAGLRKGLADPRGNLMLTYLAIAARYRPTWLVWENVPGALSVDEGRAFASLIGGMAELGYHAAWRVLDAQYIVVDGYSRAVPQRRNRVFVVGHLGDWRRASAVFLEPESLSGNPPPRREAGKVVAPTISARTSGGGGLGTDFDCDGGLIVDDAARCVTAGYAQRLDWETENFVAHSLRTEGFDASEDGSGRGTPVIPIDMRQASRGATMTNNRPDGSSGGAPGTGIGEDGDPSPTIAGSHVPAVAWSIMPQNSGKDFKARQVEVAQPIMAGGPVGGNQGGDYIQQSWAVRRLTPRECERLQGFPDDFTNIPWRGKPEAPDGPRYKALGNSMACNVMRFIGQRIQMVEDTAPSQLRSAA